MAQLPIRPLLRLLRAAHKRRWLTVVFTLIVLGLATYRYALTVDPNSASEGSPGLAPSVGYASFSAAKRAMVEVYADRPVTFYCGCSYAQGRIDASSCGLQARKNHVRSVRLEWEHVVPASWLGRGFACWAKGGRKECQRTDETFQRMAADLINLVPSAGELNADRSNFGFAEIPGEARLYGACDFEVSFSGRRAEPRPAVRGDIARIHFYFMHQYGVAVPDEQVALLRQWDAQDPVDDWELLRNALITQRQGRGNPYVVPTRYAEDAPLEDAAVTFTFD